MPPKKAAKHHEDSHHAGKDFRRAYEHLGRVEILVPALKSANKEEDVTTLVAIAQREVHVGHAKEAAGLLRAAEHLAFAALSAEPTKASQPSVGLLSAIAEEFEHLKTKAEDHWRRDEHDDALAAVYATTMSKADEAFRRKAYRKALELMRAAEALAHLKKAAKSKKHGPEKLHAGDRALRLSAS